MIHISRFTFAECIIPIVVASDKYYSQNVFRISRDLFEAHIKQMVDIRDLLATWNVEWPLPIYRYSERITGSILSQTDTMSFNHARLRSILINVINSWSTAWTKARIHKSILFS